MKKKENRMKTYTYEEALAASTEYFKGDDLAAKVFVDKYALRDNKGDYIESNPEGMHERLAREFARIDCDKYGHLFEERFEIYFNAMKHFQRIVPQGSPMAAIGNPYQKMSASNCVVVESPEDSIEGIMNSGQSLAQLMKRRCGVGLDISTLRPEGSRVNNAARTTSGAWSFADFFSYVTRMIGQNSRRGALMVTIDVHHPDVSKFATMKNDLTKVTGANVSVRLSNEFLKAVENDDEYEQRWPCEKGTTPVIRKMVSAKEVWNTIVDSATKTAEPGLIMWDNMVDNLPAHSYPMFETKSTNPCVAGDTWVMTDLGPRQVQDIIVNSGDNSAPLNLIVHGEPYQAKQNSFFKTGEKDVFKLKTVEGVELRLTSNHEILTVKDGKEEWVEAGDLIPGDRIVLHNHQNVSWSGKGSREEGYLLGYIVGDGHISKDGKLALAYVYTEGNPGYRGIMSKISAAVEHMPKRADFKGWQDRTVSHNCYRMCLAGFRDLVRAYGLNHEKEITPEVEKANSEFYKGFLSGLFDADGSVQGSQQKGVSIRLSQSNLNRLKVVQRMLLRLGIKSVIYANRKEAGMKMLPDGKGGQKEYFCKPTHELVISNDSIITFAERIGFSNTHKQNLLEKHISQYKHKPNATKWECTFASLEYSGNESVYDITVPKVHSFDANGIYVHNCSEIALSAFDSCRLISINLTGYVRNAFEENAFFDIDAFESDVMLATHMADNLVDIELELINNIKDVCSSDNEKALWQKLWNAGYNGRRVGLGTHGLGDALSQLRMKYDGDEALKQVDKIYSTLMRGAYSKSIELAKERGPFPVFDWELEKDNEYVKRLPEEIKAKLKEHGRRNIAMLTQAPTGSVSIVSKCGEFESFNISSGVEPVFRNSYVRRKKINSKDENARVDYTDALGDSWQEFTVYHGNVKNYINKIQGGETDLPDFFVTSDQIDWQRRVEIQGVEQKYIDHSISSTINLPRGTSSDVVGSLYLESWKKGLKGVTVYVDGSRDGVLVTSENKDSEGRPTQITHVQAPKRPDALPCEIHHATVKGTPWTVLLGMLDEDPYEVFMGYSQDLQIPKKFQIGEIHKVKRGSYDLHVDLGADEPLVIKNIVKTFNNPDSAWTTRMISVALRHGAPLEFIVEQLGKDGGITDVNKVLSRILKKFIRDGAKVKTSMSCPSCDSDSLVYMEGCATCQSCGWSKCN